jgi:hypothetical protein
MSIEHITEEARRRDRWHELEPLRELIDNDALLYRISNMYVHGEILTLTECLMQMVRHVAASRTDYQKHLYEWMQLHSFPAT